MPPKDDDPAVQQIKKPDIKTPSSASQDGIVPAKFDVLCGRDKVSHSHVGNNRFRHIIKMNQMRYQNATSRAGRRLESPRISSILSVPVEDGFSSLTRTRTNGPMLAMRKRTRRSATLSAAPRIPPNPLSQSLPSHAFARSLRWTRTESFEALLDEQRRIFQELLIQEGFDP